MIANCPDLDFNLINVLKVSGWNTEELQLAENSISALMSGRITMFIMSLVLSTNPEVEYPVIPSDIYKEIATYIDTLFPEKTDIQKVVLWSILCNELTLFGHKQFKARYQEYITNFNQSSNPQLN
jgi:hypothetical protein